MKDNQEIRIVGEEDLDRLIWLWKYCFTDTEQFVQWYFEQYYRQENTLGVYDDGQLISSLQMIPYQIMLRDRSIDVSYIIGVDTAPEGRQEGLTGPLLKASLEELRRRKHPFALLMPFKAGFYYRYQWAFCYFHHKYRGSIDELRNFRINYGKMMAVNPLHYKEELNQLYEQYHQGLNGYVIRSSQTWQYLLEEMILEDIHCYLLKQDDQYEGYVLYHLNGDQILVREMAFTNHHAQKALLTFLYGHRSHVKEIEWDGPVNDLLPYQLPDSKEFVTLYPFMMARIVDVVEAFDQLKFERDLPKMYIQVNDPMLPWNDGVFGVEIVDGKAEVQLVEGKSTVDVVISIEGLTQLFFGALSGDQLAFQGQLEIIHSDHGKLWNQLWTKQVNYMNEYY